MQQLFLLSQKCSQQIHPLDAHTTVVSSGGQAASSFLSDHWIGYLWASVAICVGFTMSWGNTRTQAGCVLQICTALSYTRIFMLMCPSICVVQFKERTDLRDDLQYSRKLLHHWSFPTHAARYDKNRYRSGTLPSHAIPSIAPLQLISEIRTRCGKVLPKI